VTDGLPAQDMMKVKRFLRRYPREKKMRLIGPNCAGIISPGKGFMGIMPPHIYTPGRVGIVGRSGTLGYEAASQMQALGIGVSSSIGIGGDPINGSSFRDILELFENDPETDAVMMIGEIGGPQEAEAAEYVRDHMTKPVAAYVAGLSAPKGRKMGHAGAIISAFGESAQERSFRFSAATYNAHRIHYDLPYAQEVEKYPALVTHGPMQAIMLIDAATRHAGERRCASGSAACTRCSTTTTCGFGQAGPGGRVMKLGTAAGRVSWNDSGSGVGLMGILSGMRVVEGSAFVAVPLAGMTLAQMGADVIRFDRLEGGLDAGRWPVTQDGPEPVLGGAQQGQAVDRDRHEEPARARSSRRSSPRRARMRGFSSPTCACAAGWITRRCRRGGRTCAW
jgi:hypothetical protein